MRSESQRLFAVSLLCAALLLACGKKVAEDSLVIPRGATFAVRTVDAITSSGVSEGDSFVAQLEGPLLRNRVMYVSAGARVEGVIDELEENDAGQHRVVVRLVRMELPGGKSVEIKTRPLGRDSQDTQASTEEITAATGIESLIHKLAETGGGPSSADNSGDTGGGTLVVANSPIVFTLDSDLVIPKPETPIVVPLPSSPERRTSPGEPHTLTMSVEENGVDTIQAPNGDAFDRLTPSTTESIR